MTDFDSLRGQSRNEAPDKLDRVSMDSRRRQAIGNDDCKLRRAAGVARQQMLGLRIEPASEVGTPEIIRPVADATGDSMGRETKIIETGDDGGEVEGGMNRVAGSRVVERKFEQRFGWHACARSA